MAAAISRLSLRRPRSRGQARESHRDAARSSATHAAGACHDREDDKDLLAEIDTRPGKWLARLDDKRVERIWRREGLKVPQKQPKKGRRWLNDGSCVRLRPARPNHVWSVDLVHDRLSNGRPYKMLTVLDEYTREALCVTVATRMGAHEVLEALTPLILERGAPTHLRSDNGPEFIGQPLQDWLQRVGIEPIRILPGSPWENGYNERFNGTLRRELLDAEWFVTTRQAQIVINIWLRQYNHI